MVPVRPGIAAAALLLTLGGCGTPPGLRGADEPPRPRLSAPGASSAPALADPALPPPGYTQYPLPPVNPPLPPPVRPSPSPTATRCAGSPTEAQVLKVVRAAPGLPSGATLRVTDGPYCAGRWQYTVLGGGPSTPDSEPLLAVTRGKPADLTLVELGTNVCSDKVTAAPPAIHQLACG